MTVINVRRPRIGSPCYSAIVEIVILLLLLLLLELQNWKGTMKELTTRIHLDSQRQLQVVSGHRDHYQPKQINVNFWSPFSFSCPFFHVSMSWIDASEQQLDLRAGNIHFLKSCTAWNPQNRLLMPFRENLTTNYLKESGTDKNHVLHNLMTYGEVRGLRS